MRVTSYAAFVAMYQALEAANDEMKDESLRRYLSDANPFLFKDKGSADPAIYIEFEQMFNKRFADGTDPKGALSVVKDYLREQNGGVLAVAFDSVVNSANWEKH